MSEQEKMNPPTIYGLYESCNGLYPNRGGYDELLLGVDTDPEALRLRYNTYQQNNIEIPEGKRKIEFRDTTSGGLDFIPYCYYEIRVIVQFDKKDKSQ